MLARENMLYLLQHLLKGLRVMCCRHHELFVAVAPCCSSLKHIWQELDCGAGALNQLKANSTLFTDSDTDALNLLRSWITQPGYPLVNVSDSNTVQQARFYSWGSAVRNDTFLTSNDSSWYVPLQLGPQDSASSVPLTTAGLATAGSSNAGTTWVEMLQQPQIRANLTGPIINKAATRFYR